MLYLLPTTYGVYVPSSVMKAVAPQIDPEATILWGDEATPEKARGTLLKLNPPYVFTTGHGIPCVTTLQDKEPFISLDVREMNPEYCNAERNLDIVKGRVWHVHSCWCGRLLAPEMVKRGAWAVFAHDHEFLFLLPEGDRADIVVVAPFLAEFTTDMAMLSGQTAGGAQRARMEAYEKQIRFFQKGEGAKLKQAPIITRILLADKMISKLYGDPTATVAKPRPLRKARLDLPLELEGAPSGSWLPLLALPVGLMLLGGGHGGKAGHYGLD